MKDTIQVEMKEKINYIILVLKNFKSYKVWNRTRKGIKDSNWTRGCGFYITTELLGYNPIGEIKEFEMKSGKTALYELLSYKTFRDPSDMIEESRWHFVGYKNEKAIKDCTFIEFLNMYPIKKS